MLAAENPSYLAGAQNSRVPSSRPRVREQRWSSARPRCQSCRTPLRPRGPSYPYRNAGAWVARPATGTRSRGKVSQSNRRSPWRGSRRSWKSCSAAWLLWVGRTSSASAPRGSAWWARASSRQPGPWGWRAGGGPRPGSSAARRRRGSGGVRRGGGTGRAGRASRPTRGSASSRSLLGTSQLSISARFLRGRVRSCAEGWPPRGVGAHPAQPACTTRRGPARLVPAARDRLLPPLSV